MNPFQANVPRIAATCPRTTGHRAAKDPAASETGRARQSRFRNCASVLPLVVCCGCVSTEPGAWLGTGTLQTSGTSSEQFASHAIEFWQCVGREEDASQSFSILAIGDRCVIDSASMSTSTFRPDRGSDCTLPFPEGDHTLRVTDVTMRHDTDGRFIDSTYLDVDLGGDDETSGHHALYHFTGRWGTGPYGGHRCADERPRHERYLGEHPNSRPVDHEASFAPND